MIDRRLNVLVAGGGVAGLEALLALHDIAARQVSLTLLAPEPEFVYRPMAVGHPFSRGHAQHRRLSEVATDVGAQLVRAAVTAVEPTRRTVVTDAGERYEYDALLVAIGARTATVVEHASTWTPESDPEVYGGILRDIEEGYTRRLAFVVPPRVAWPLPAYELALMTGWAAREASREDIEITIHTPEEGPLALFGAAASASLRQDLDQLGIQVRTGVEVLDGRTLDADHVIALPQAVGPGLPGLPSDARGFIPTDVYGKVDRTEHVWAAGDVTAFPVKQGGIAAQQADAAAFSIAHAAGAPVTPAPFHPVLRGVLLTGRGRAWLRRDLDGADEGTAERRALFWPPTKVAGRYIAPYLLAEHTGATPATRWPTGQLIDLEVGA